MQCLWHWFSIQFRRSANTSEDIAEFIANKIWKMKNFRFSTFIRFSNQSVCQHFRLSLYLSHSVSRVHIYYLFDRKQNAERGKERGAEGKRESKVNLNLWNMFANAIKFSESCSKTICCTPSIWTKHWLQVLEILCCCRCCSLFLFESFEILRSDNKWTNALTVNDFCFLWVFHHL